MNHTSFSKRHKRDATHSEVAETLAALGWSVFDASKMGAGCPDLLIGRMGVTDLVEVKTDAKAVYTGDQRRFNQMWRGADVVRLENKAQAEAWAKRAIRDRQAQVRGCVHRTLPAVIPLDVGHVEGK